MVSCFPQNCGQIKWNNSEGIDTLDLRSIKTWAAYTDGFYKINMKVRSGTFQQEAVYLHKNTQIQGQINYSSILTNFLHKSYPFFSLYINLFFIRIVYIWSKFWAQSLHLNEVKSKKCTLRNSASGQDGISTFYTISPN